MQVSEDLLKAGRGYEALFVPAVFGSWTSKTIVAACVGPGDVVLDLACGTGVLTREVAKTVGPEGHVVGLDPAPGMLAAAREIAPDIEFRSGAAEALNWPDDSFDAVLCQFGLMFFEDRPRALAEIRRVLRPGGQLGIVVWDGVARNPGYRAVISLIEEELGAEAANAMRLPFSLGDPDALVAEFTAAGFRGVQATTLQGQARFPSPQVMVEADLRGWLPLFDIILDEDRIAGILAKAETALADFTEPGGKVVFTTTAHVLNLSQDHQE